MQDPSTKQTEREAYSEFVAALDTARSRYFSALGTIDDDYALAVRAVMTGTNAPRYRIGTLEAAERYRREQREATTAYLNALS